MYEIFKNALKGQYELVDMLNKITEYYIKGNLSKEEKEELEEEARTNANPENSYADVQKQIDDLAQKIEELQVTVNANAQGTNAIKEAVEKLGGVITPPEEQPTEEYPEYKQPSGSHDAYKIGDKITYNEKRYECIFNGCVWNPDDYPQGWKEVEE
jgi:flavin-dependent dehydrogenase